MILVKSSLLDLFLWLLKLEIVLSWDTAAVLLLEDVEPLSIMLLPLLVMVPQQLETHIGSPKTLGELVGENLVT